MPVLIGGAAVGEEPQQAIAFVLDLTERKRVEAEARETECRYRQVEMELAHANRVATMGQLTASIAHEVKQPIAATVSNAQAGLRWLKREPPDLEEVREALACIVKDGKRAGDVVGRIRDLIQKAPPRKDRFDLNAAIREVIELTRSEVVKNGVSVQTQFMDNLPLIDGDRVQLQQVVLNLIINAMEAMSGLIDGPRELLITTGRAETGGVHVAVRDSGPRLAPAALERLFEAFYTTKPNGSGLGLSICHSIIEAHGGRCGRAPTFLAARPFNSRCLHPRPTDLSCDCPREWRTDLRKSSFSVVLVREGGRSSSHKAVRDYWMPRFRGASRGEER